MRRPPRLDARLASLLGQWQGHEEVAPSAYNPDGASIPVRYRFQAAVNGQIVTSDYQQTDAEGQIGFAAHGVYRAEGEQIELYAFDASGMPPDCFMGPLTDGCMVLTAENLYGRWRLIQHLPDDTGRFVSRLELWDDEAGWKLFSEGYYTR